MTWLNWAQVNGRKGDVFGGNFFPKAPKVRGKSAIRPIQESCNSGINYLIVARVNRKSNPKVEQSGIATEPRGAPKPNFPSKTNAICVRRAL
jgi:hypothetical protein